LKKETLAVADLLSDICTSFSGQAEAAGIDLHVGHKENMAMMTIFADFGRLEQVLAHLIMNALRYTPAGGSIAVWGAYGTGGVHIVVRDTGRGIPPEDIPSIFNRFWRGDPSRSHTDGTTVVRDCQLPGNSCKLMVDASMLKVSLVKERGSLSSSLHLFPRTGRVSFIGSLQTFKNQDVLLGKDQVSCASAFSCSFLTVKKYSA
jgi:hypothetical protein